MTDNVRKLPGSAFSRTGGAVLEERITIDGKTESRPLIYVFAGGCEWAALADGTVVMFVETDAGEKQIEFTGKEVSEIGAWLLQMGVVAQRRADLLRGALQWVPRWEEGPKGQEGQLFITHMDRVRRFLPTVLRAARAHRTCQSCQAAFSAGETVYVDAHDEPRGEWFGGVRLCRACVAPRVTGPRAVVEPEG